MIRNSFLGGITKYWWLPLLTGLVCVGLGVWSILSPSQSLPVIAMAFAICLLFVGLFDAIWGFATANHNPGWGWDLCLAVIDIVAGVWMLNMTPEQMTITFLYIVGIWLIFAAFNGIGQMMAISVYNPVATVLAVILLIGTIFFSFWLIINPIGLGVVAWVWLGIALVCYGVFKIAVSIKVKNFRNKLN